MRTKGSRNTIPRRNTKCIGVALPQWMQEALEELATENERSITSQARFMLRRSLVACGYKDPKGGLKKHNEKTKHGQGSPRS